VKDTPSHKKEIQQVGISNRINENINKIKYPQPLWGFKKDFFVRDFNAIFASLFFKGGVRI
jgi:hypothetical protein